MRSWRIWWPGGRRCSPSPCTFTFSNRLGCRDPFSLPEATDRQRRYAARLPQGEVYTPQLVLQGRRAVIGSDCGAVAAALAASPALHLPVAAALVGAEITLDAGAAPADATTWLLGFDAGHSTQVTAGENRGRRITHVNVVLSLRRIDRAPGAIRIARPAGERVALLLKAGHGAIVGAAALA